MKARHEFKHSLNYGDADYIMLEKKSKAHGMCYKRSVKLTATEAAALQSEDLFWMVNDERELIRELYSKMRSERLKPKTVVDYIREPFICAAGNVRIMLDRGIRTGLYSTDFLNDSLQTVKAGDELVLLEVKYDQFIPDYITNVLQMRTRRAAAVPKTRCAGYTVKTNDTRLLFHHIFAV